MERFRRASFAGVDGGGGTVAAHVGSEQFDENHIADGIDTAADERQHQRQPGFFVDFRRLLLRHIASEGIAGAFRAARLGSGKSYTLSRSARRVSNSVRGEVQWAVSAGIRAEPVTRPVQAPPR